MWSITDADGTRWSASYCPPATLAEVEATYPDATVEPEDEPAPTGALDPAAEGAIRSWLGSIDEHDPQTIGEVLDRCRADGDALAYFLRRAAEAGIAPQPEPPPEDGAQKAVCARINKLVESQPWPTTSLSSA